MLSKYFEIKTNPPIKQIIDSIWNVTEAKLFNKVTSTTISIQSEVTSKSKNFLGAGYKLSENIIVNAAFEMGLNNSLKASNPSLIANEYSNSTSELATTLIHFSFNYSF